MNKIVLDEMEGQEFKKPEAQSPTYHIPHLCASSLPTSHLPTNTSLGDSEQSYRLHRVYFKNLFLVISKSSLKYLWSKLQSIIPSKCFSL